MATATKKYQKASTVCCSANVLLFLAYQCAFFGRIFLYENLARLSSSGSQNLQKIPGKFVAPLKPSRSLTLPFLLVNPIPHRRYQGAGKLHAADERKLQTLLEDHRWVLLRGTFFLQVAAQCAFFGRIFFSENLARILSSGSQNLEKIPGNFLAPFEHS